MEAYRTAYVYVREVFAGTLKETDAGYSFIYDKEYLSDKNSSAASLQLSFYFNFRYFLGDNFITDLNLLEKYT